MFCAVISSFGVTDFSVFQIAYSDVAVTGVSDALVTGVLGVSVALVASFLGVSVMVCLADYHLVMFCVWVVACIMLSLWVFALFAACRVSGSDLCVSCFRLSYSR